MTESFLSRHRTICSVLEELRTFQPYIVVDQDAQGRFAALIDEAKDYAQRMSNRLMEYKRKEEGHSA